MEHKTGLIVGGGIILAAIAVFLFSNQEGNTGAGSGGSEGGSILGTGYNPSDITSLPSDNFGGFPSPELLTLNQLLTPPPPIDGVTYEKKAALVKITSPEAFNVGSSGDILNRLIPTPATKLASYGDTDLYVGKTLYGSTVDIAIDKKSNIATVTDPARALTPLKFNLGPDLGQIFGLGANSQLAPITPEVKAAINQTDAFDWTGNPLATKATMNLPRSNKALNNAIYQAGNPAIVSASGDIYPYGYTSAKKATFTETGPAASKVYAIGGISTSRALDTAEQSMTAAKYASYGWTPPKSGPSVVLSKKGG